MTERSPLDDDELLAMLGSAIAETDPVPELVLEAAKLVPGIAGIDAELALLTFDSDRELAGVRGAGTGRQLTFEAGEIELELVVHTEEIDGRRALVFDGQVVPPWPLEVSLIAADPFTESRSAQADELGRFRFVDVPAGAIRLAVRAGDRQVRARPVVTSWFRS